ncbi:uncharacterized protein FOMMEDRAFT_139693 [Fomitiporia mediterranea MF3/22]|uniref:uncharacterized protein n=1 Tax=Fomitiporia mediterranea (strain MF3/22) TaxID=694068 RepID=UPI0004409CB6|nr:uncharacterized protein FOMMEDRAFT_139693 [Fomitiporia mediterranea MF3/22]EJD05186.1 hypothetical protein FOMMEDRAFT_139693 [Fomitiporia mediterranea MF3/22]
MHSLEFLYIEDWVGLETEVLNWNEHPPSSLKAMGLCLDDTMEEETLAWLLRPRGSFNLLSLFIRQRRVYQKSYYQELILSLRSSLHQLEHLSMTMLDIQDVDASVINDLLLNCNKLTSLDLFYD